MFWVAGKSEPPRAKLISQEWVKIYMNLLDKIYQQLCEHDWSCEFISISNATGVNAPEHKLTCKVCGATGVYTKVNYNISVKKLGQPESFFPLWHMDAQESFQYKVDEIILSRPSIK